MRKKEENMNYALEIERSKEMEEKIDDSCKHMADEFRMTQAALQVTDMQGDYNV